MDLIKLAIIFIVIIVLINFKIRLNIAVAVGAVLGAILYQMGFVHSFEVAWRGVWNADTISVIVITYLITFLQRMMEQKGDLLLAQRSLSGIFNSRRVNASVAPIFIGLLPSPAAAFIAGDMVKSSCGDYLDKNEQAFVTSYFRHIPESCLPTYSSIILAVSLSGVALNGFLLSMVLPVMLLIVLGYLFYLRRVPKDTGLPPAQSKAREWRNLVASLWPIALAIVLVIAVPYIPFSAISGFPPAAAEFLGSFPVWLAVIISIVLYFFIGRFRFKEVIPYFSSAFELNIMLNTVVVMIFKEILTESGVIAELPDTLSKLPIPTFLVFALLFLIGTIVGGSTAIVTLCTAPAFAAMPDGGVPLLMLLMCFSYAAMQISPTHLCLTLIAEYFDSNFGVLVKKTIPVIAIFMVLILGYYLLLTLFL